MENQGSLIPETLFNPLLPTPSSSAPFICGCFSLQVRAVIGTTYMLSQDEVLWEKELPPGVEELLNRGQDPLADRGQLSQPRASQPPVTRNKTRVVSYRVPHNAAVQVYDYREKKAR